MTRKSPGETLPPQRWTTLAGEYLTVPTGAPVTHIQFRRFAGCPICNLHLRSFIARRSEIIDSGIHEVVVFHSTAEELRRHEADLPFDVIPDPDRHLYRQFGVESDHQAIFDPRVWGTIAHAVARSSLRVAKGQRPMPPINPEGGRYGLPGDFLIAPDGRIIDVHYGEHANDQMSVETVLASARRFIERSNQIQGKEH